MREATTEELLERIKELEENEQVLNDAHCKLMDKCEKLEAELKKSRIYPRKQKINSTFA